ncbi:CHRD domain-containing protein [Nonomuraea sp. NPDC050547]|uniref:CHRD domain-containing protein n=1 Tax=Nonomuraea sp. NPDC050547 TaxID=3364368 RepID=UPI00378C05E4
MRKHLAVVGLTAAAALLGSSTPAAATTSTVAATSTAVTTSTVAATSTAAASTAATATAATTVDHRPRVVKLSGKQEVPGPGDRNGSGAFFWRVKGWHLCYALSVRKIRPATAAHIHRGAIGVAGAVTVTLRTPSDGFAKGCVRAVKRQNAANAATTLTWSELRAIKRWPHNYYVNVHNKRFPMGAVRGQLR